MQNRTEGYLVFLRVYDDRHRTLHDEFIDPAHIIRVGPRIGQWGRGLHGKGECTFTRQVTMTNGPAFHAEDNAALAQFIRPERPAK